MSSCIPRRGAPCSLLVFAWLWFAAAAHPEEAFPVSGTVRDAAGRPLAGAVISVAGSAATTYVDATGAFRLLLPAGEHTLRVSQPGYEAVTRRLRVSSDLTGVDFSLALLYRHTEEVVVRAIRADAEVPVTKKDIDREEIERLNYGQEMPFLLKETPSVTQYSETGNGAGYSYLYLRGIQQTRVNMTLDGVPLNDGEDSAVYFVDFGNFAGSLESIQIQRGVGTSTVGAASYAGSINFASVDLRESRELAAEVGAGSFGTDRASLGYQTGNLGPLAFYARGSYQKTDGFREHSGVIQRSLFFGGSRHDERSFFKVSGFSGHENIHQAFLATDQDTLARDLRFNPLSPADTDHFGEDLVQAQYTRFLSPSSSLALQGYYVGAYGAYRLWDDEVARRTLLEYGLDWRFLGAMMTFHHTQGRVTFDAGVHANDFASHHTQDVVGGSPVYTNHGYKNEANAFAKLGYAWGRWRLYGDAQVRWARFRYQGDIGLGSVDWTFFNPKLGARFDATPNLGLYASVGRTTREPTRGDMLLGEDNATVFHDLRAVQPERVVDFEAGAEYRRPGLAVQANVYDMEFRNEIALTGELSEIGLPLRRNVDRSHRRGLEWDVTWRPWPQVRLTHSANLSRNGIRTWNQFYDVYDASGTLVGSEPRVYHDVDPLLTPPFVANLGLDWTPTQALSLGVAGRYVAKSYLDNTHNEALSAPRFFDLDATLLVNLGRWIRTGQPRLRVRVNNVLNDHRIYLSGYSYLYLTRDAVGGESLGGTPYYYPLATRSVLVALDLKL
jgi:iron complex outermembrane receptor protein